MSEDPDAEPGFWKSGLFIVPTLIVTVVAAIALEDLLEPLAVDTRYLVWPVMIAGVSFMTWATSSKLSKPGWNGLGKDSFAIEGLEKDASVGGAILFYIIRAVLGLALFILTAVLMRYPMFLNIVAFLPAAYLMIKLTGPVYRRLRRRSANN